MTYAITTSGLKRTFGDFAAVDQLDLNVAAGSFFGFLGPNGAGKSTTIKMLTGLLKISGGRATVLGYDVERQPVEVKQRIGVLPEELALFDRLSAREYLDFVGRMYGMRKKVIRARSEELLELMDLGGERRKQIVDFSHGMRKKLALCSALIHEPRLLFLDEPFEGIDAVASRLIKDLLGSLIESGVTIFLTSHILEIVEKLCDQIAVIHRGRLVAQGSQQQLRHDVPGAASLEELFLSLVDSDEPHRKPTLSWLG